VSHKNEMQMALASSPSPDVLLRMHHDLLQIRCTEETIARRYALQEMRTPIHLGVGQEAIAVGISHALKPGDVAYSHHRSHNHYLAMGGSVRKLAAELHGRATGCSGGKGGSVHLTARSNGFIASSAILGETVACAVGSALAFKMDRAPNIAVTFFGDATCEEGILYESMNFAATKKLPVLFVCENNLYSTESPLSVRQPEGTELTRRAEAFNLKSYKGDGNDVVEVHRIASNAIAQVRSGQPVFLELLTYRWREHVGPQYDHELGRTYRTREELETWQQRCPIKSSAHRLQELGFSTKSELAALEEQIKSEVDALFESVRQDPWPEISALMTNVS
jgi:TPP-dependent pyruvate/acetoin dehydrogenase alpha subunit